MSASTARQQAENLDTAHMGANMRHPFDALVGHWNTTGDNVPAGDDAAISIRGMDKYDGCLGASFSFPTSMCGWERRR